MSTKLIINLFGGPGTGKSTVAAGVFHKVKQLGINAELVQEHAKDWAWEGRQIGVGDQLCISAEQAKRERRLLKDCDLIITDSPLLLGVYYEDKYDAHYNVTPHILRKQKEIVKELGWEYLNIFLNRVKPFNPKGRFHSEEESKQIDAELLELLARTSTPFFQVDADDLAVDHILKHLN
jgi:sugar phosphate isomerase/epimerase